MGSMSSLERGGRSCPHRADDLDDRDPSLTPLTAAWTIYKRAIASTSSMRISFVMMDVGVCTIRPTAPPGSSAPTQPLSQPSHMESRSFHLADSRPSASCCRLSIHRLLRSFSNDLPRCTKDLHSVYVRCLHLRARLCTSVCTIRAGRNIRRGPSRSSMEVQRRITAGSQSLVDGIRWCCWRTMSRIDRWNSDVGGWTKSDSDGERPPKRWKN